MVEHVDPMHLPHDTVNGETLHPLANRATVFIRPLVKIESHSTDTARGSREKPTKDTKPSVTESARTTRGKSLNAVVTNRMYLKDEVTSNNFEPDEKIQATRQIRTVHIFI